MAGPGSPAPRAQRRREERSRGKQAAGRSANRWWVGGGIAAVAIVAALAVGLRQSGPTDGPPAGTQTFTEKDRGHVEGRVKYDHVPAAGGNHAKVWQNCGVYADPVLNENVVHSLEHGAVWVTYSPALSATDVKALTTLVQSKYNGPDRYVVLSPYPGQPANVMVTAWGNQLSAAGVTDPRVAAAIEYFREGPQNLEAGASCSRGVGTPLA